MEIVEHVWLKLKENVCLRGNPASCIRKPTDSMKVKTSSEKAKKSRELVFELLLADQPKKEIAHDNNSDFGNG